VRLTGFDIISPEDLAVSQYSIPAWREVLACEEIPLVALGDPPPGPPAPAPLEATAAL
jgi:hypothetical protein